MLLFSCFNKSYPRHLCQGDASKINYWFLFSSSHFVLLPEDGKKKKCFCPQHEKLRSLCCCCRYAGAGTRPFTCQNCGDALSLSWTSQPAPTWRPHTQTSSNRSSRGTRTTCSMSASRYEREGGSLRLQQFSEVDFYVLPNSQCHFLCVLPGGQQQRVCRSSVRHPLSAGELFFENSGAHLHSQAQLHGDA